MKTFNSITTAISWSPIFQHPHTVNTVNPLIALLEKGAGGRDPFELELTLLTALVFTANTVPTMDHMT